MTRIPRPAARSAARGRLWRPDDGEAATLLARAGGLDGRVVAEEVRKLAEQSSASAEQVSASTQQTSASTQEIASSAAALAGTAQQLDAVVGRFRLAL